MKIQVFWEEFLGALCFEFLVLCFSFRFDWRSHVNLEVILMGAVVGAFATAAKWQGGLATLFPCQDIATTNAALNGCGNAMAWRQGFSTLQRLSTKLGH